MTGRRTALVTGAAGTVGAAIADGLSRAGYPIALTDMDEAGLNAVCAGLPGPAMAVAADAAVAGTATGS